MILASTQANAGKAYFVHAHTMYTVSKALFQAPLRLNVHVRACVCT